MGYKGSRGKLTDAEQEEFDILSEIIRNAGEYNIVGDALLGRHHQLDMLSGTDAGYFYCPYIPLMTCGTIVDPNSLQPVKSFVTRYGKL